MKASNDMKQFIEKYPEAYVAAGKEGITYAMTQDQVTKATFDADILPFGTQYTQAGLEEITGYILNPSEFLANLARNMIEDARRLSCDMTVRPGSVEGSASLGVVSFSASWELSELCD